MATYSINSSGSGMNFYCHWDNHFNGAAVRFYNMISALTEYEDCRRGIKDSRGGLAFAFIRGNFDAEVHEATQYNDDHYEVVTQDDGVVMLKYFEAYSGDHDLPVFEMPLVDFINQQYADIKLNHPDQEIEGLEQVMAVVNPDDNQTRLTTVRTAELISQHFLKKSEQFTPDNPNKAGYLARSLAWKPMS